MKKIKPLIIIDPFPRSLDLIFTKSNLNYLKSNFILIEAPKKNKKKFYIENIHSAIFIIGQPHLPKEILSKAKNLKAIFNVESNFIDNMDYKYCFEKGIYVLSTSPVFAQPVAEMSLGLTLSLARSIHIAHNDFINKKEKYGGLISKDNFLLKNKKFAFIGFGDLGKSLLPLIRPFSNQIMAYDPWVPEILIKKNNVDPMSLKNIFKNADIIFILASITSSNQNMINLKTLNLMRDFSSIILMSRAAIIDFNDFYKFLKARNVFAAIDVFPDEPFPKNHKMRLLKNVLFSPHRAGALDSAFKEMGEIVLGDIKLLIQNLPPKLCKKAEIETVSKLNSKPVTNN